MKALLWSVAVLPVALFTYAYLVYPLVAGLLARLLSDEPTVWQADPETWPTVTILIPVYNEAHTIAEKLDNTLSLDYPSDRLQILVASDASTDGTDAIANSYGDRGVELARLHRRGGKEAAQNHAFQFVRGDIIVNSDATTRLKSESLKALVRPFSEPGVGVVSGHAVGRAQEGGQFAQGETLYVFYEMAVRRFETRLGSIVGATGAFYGVRADLFDDRYPSGLNRDFGEVLMARESGFRSVLMERAICYVPAGRSLRREFGRKMRTMSRGLRTLFHFRRLLNPLRFGRFSILLGSHKLARWSVYLTWPAAVLALVVLATDSFTARLALGSLASLAAIGLTAVYWPSDTKGTFPYLLRLVGYAVVAASAGVGAWVRLLRGERLAYWEPTRRGGTETLSSSP